MSFACTDWLRTVQIPSPFPIRTVSITKKAQEPACLHVSPLWVSIFSLIIRKLCDRTFISVQKVGVRGGKSLTSGNICSKAIGLFSQFSPKMKNAYNNCHHTSPTEADGKSSAVIQLRNSSIIAPCIQIPVQKINETLATEIHYLTMSFKNEWYIC